MWALAPAIAASTVVYLTLAAWLIRRGHDLTLIAVGAAFVVILGLWLAKRKEAAAAAAGPHEAPVPDSAHER